MGTTLDLMRQAVTPHLAPSADLRPTLSRADQRYSRIMGCPLTEAGQ